MSVRTTLHNTSDQASEKLCSPDKMSDVRLVYIISPTRHQCSQNALEFDPHFILILDVLSFVHILSGEGLLLQAL